MKDLGGSNFDEMIDIVNQKDMMNWGEEIALKKAANDSSGMTSNKDEFIKEIKNIGGCLKYDPCPLCFKCNNKASHLYVKCQICRIPICVHTHGDVYNMIKRDNHAVVVTSDEKTMLKNIAEEVEERK